MEHKDDFVINDVPFLPILLATCHKYNTEVSHFDSYGTKFFLDYYCRKIKNITTLTVKQILVKVKFN